MDFWKYNKNERYSRLMAFFIIAILAAISTFFILNTDSIKVHQYRLKEVGNEEVPTKMRIYYDLDNDGLSELFYFVHYGTEDVVEFFNSKKGFIDVLRPGGRFLGGNPSYLIGDFDADNFAEIYLFSLKKDSILLNGYELMGDDGHFIVDQLLEAGIPEEDKNDLSFFEPEIVDLDLDGSLEMLFIIKAGYSKSPRKIYSFNPITSELVKSDESALGLSGFQVISLPGVEGQVVLVASNAIENFSKGDSIPFNDNTAWLVAYDKTLKQPVYIKEYPDNKTHIQTAVLYTPNGPRIYNLIHEKNTGIYRLERLNLDGSFEKSVKVSPGSDGYIFLNYFSPYFESIVLSHSDSLYYYNHDLEKLRKVTKIGIPKTFFYTFGRSFIQKSGILIFGRGDELMVHDLNSNVLGKIEIPNLYTERGYYVSLKEFRSPDNYIISLSGKNHAHLIELKKNPLYGIRFFIILILFIALNFLYYLIFRLQNYFYNKRQNTRIRISSLQLQTVQNQLQPHFTFNVLNTIGSMIYKNRKEEAYEYLNYFSDMLRSTFLSRNQPSWQIGEELSFIGAYIAMENLRFDNKFQYLQKIDQGVELTDQLPKLSIQSFVENAVRHGLMHSKQDCLLWVSVKQTENHNVIIVEDNGIGRSAAAKLSRRQSGLGNKILEEYIEIYNQTNKIKFKFNIEDLYDVNGKASGTKIVFRIPKNVNLTGM